MLQNIQFFTRQQAQQSNVASMKIILTSSSLTFQVLCTKLKPAVAWFHWQITLVAILHVQEKNPGQGSLCCIICWLKHTTHTLPLFPCRVLLYMHLMQMGTQKGRWLLTLSQEEGTLYLPAESQFMQSHVMAAELYSPYCFMGSCILNTLMVKCWLTLIINILIYTWLTLDRHLINSQSLIDQLSTDS